MSTEPRGGYRFAALIKRHRAWMTFYARENVVVANSVEVFSFRYKEMAGAFFVPQVDVKMQMLVPTSTYTLDDDRRTFTCYRFRDDDEQATVARSYDYATGVFTTLRTHLAFHPIVLHRIRVLPRWAYSLPFIGAKRHSRGDDLPTGVY